jgi:hypothetical protein
MEWNGMEWNGMEWNGMEWNEHRMIIIIIFTIIITKIPSCLLHFHFPR